MTGGCILVVDDEADIRDELQEYLVRKGFRVSTADGGPALLLGAPWRSEDKLYNAALLLDGGALAAKRFKHNEFQICWTGVVLSGLTVGQPKCCH